MSGKVQGVGFRPFVYRLAHQLDLRGWVRNNLGQVEILAQGDGNDLDQFHTGLIEQSPAISEPLIVSCNAYEVEYFSDFQILPSSENVNNPDIHVPSDYFTCPDCLAELQDPNDRRYQYPFINCTQCGPRYTLIENLPYDRPNTSMAGFPLCDDCLAEYEDPLDRRFHAEPLACPVCGPQLQYINKSKDKGSNPEQTIENTTQALEACIKALKSGQIVAVKGVGGYHLMCDATNDIAIQQLRKRKGRPHKPLAVMFPTKGNDDLEVVRESVEPSADEAGLMRSPSRPIVLVSKHDNAQSKLSELIAPGLGEIGVMLAYSPLHHLLLNAMDVPLVATSANISGEPVLTDKESVEKRLNHITNYFLHHNRPIVRPADDSVYREIAAKLRPIRLGRGHVPVEIELPFQINEPMLACGSHMKNTIALAWNNRLVVSPHIGDLDSPRSMQVFEQTIDDLQRLYQVQATSLACDAHPDYGSTRWAIRWAKKNGFPLTKIQHHQAHASALVLEHWSDNHNKLEPWLVFSWDGTGFGDDQSIWGGEAFYGHPGNWKRVASMRPFHLPGGIKAARELWRSATALCWEEGYACPDIPTDTKLLERAWRQGINSPKTTAVGRLFDAASVLTGQIMEASYEGQGPMLLEHASDALYSTEPLPIARNGVGNWQADWADLLPELRNQTINQQKRATMFHSRIAHTLLKQVELIREIHPFTHIGLSGGVFQNKKLSDYVIRQLQQQNYTACIAEKLPINDAGISAGQIVEAAMQSLQNINE